MQTDTMREKLFTMRMSDEESARLDALARHYSLTAAGVIRMLVKRDFDAVKPADPPRPTAKKKAQK